MSDIAIKVENLSKRYRIGLKEQMPDTFVGAITSWLTAPLANFQQVRKLSHFSENGGGGSTRLTTDPDDVIWALRDVSFEIKQGEVVGIIGRNGAGKSTLLKILSRITEPTSGRAIISGRVSSLLEVGTGFHPELTGRENVYLNGTVLGMSKQEIDRKFDAIVDFSGVEKFMDTPVKRYSSGMNVRLAFSVAAHLEPEILMVDEVLAVGDVAFQKKCLGKMGDVSKEGRTVLFVSHNMAAIQSLCEKTLWLSRGQKRIFHETDETVTTYLESVANVNITPLKERHDRQGDGKLRLVAFDAHQDSENRSVICGRPASFLLHFETLPDMCLQNVHISIAVNTLLGENVLYFSNDLVGVEFSDLPSYGKLVCHVDRLPLATGSYSVNLYCTVNGILADWVIDAARLSVEQGDYFGTGRLTPSSHGKVLVSHSWNLQAQ